MPTFCASNSKRLIPKPKAKDPPTPLDAKKKKTVSRGAITGR
jgi:hypothetical protein